MEFRINILYLSKTQMKPLYQVQCITLSHEKLIHWNVKYMLNYTEMQMHWLILLLKKNVCTKYDNRLPELKVVFKQ